MLIRPIFRSVNIFEADYSQQAIKQKLKTNQRFCMFMAGLNHLKYETLKGNRISLGQSQSVKAAKFYAYDL